MEITILSALGLNNAAVPTSSVDLFASTLHLESIPLFFIGLTTTASESDKRCEVVLNWGNEKICKGVEPSFFADTRSYFLLRITRLSKRLMFIGPRREEVLWCRIPISDVGFPVSFLSYRMRNQRDGSRSDVVVNLRVEPATARIGHPSVWSPSMGAVIGIPAIKPFES